MNQSLPERPNLEQLKRQAKELLKAIHAGEPKARQRASAISSSVEKFSLHDAQLVIAREHGFTSWAKLKLRVETLTESAIEARLILANVRGDLPALNALLEKHGTLATRIVFGAAAFGDLDAVQKIVGENASAATAPGGPVNWPPILYLCFGQRGGSDESRAAIAQILLDRGADPNSSYVDPRWPESALPALYGATGANNYPTLARTLLRAGANPNDGESRYHAAEHFHRESLEVLHEFGADWSANDPAWNNTPLYFLFGYQHPPQATRDGIRWLLEHSANPNVLCYRDKQSESPLHAAIHNGWDLATIQLLLDHGADPQLRRRDGRTPFALAVGMGRTDVAELMRSRGAVETLSPVDELLGACMRADAQRAKAIFEKFPDLLSRLSNEERKIALLAAQRGAADAIALMAEIGFDVNVQDADGGATPLHWAAWQGQAAAVKTLLRFGAQRDALDSRFKAPPVGWCAHGSLHANNPRGDYPATMTALLEARAQIPANLEGSAEVMKIVAQFKR